MNHWYVLKTKPKKERQVQERLKLAHFEVFLPLIKGFFSTKPLFPSYLFVKTNFHDPLSWRKVCFTRGTSKILGDGDGPLPISDFIVETLRESSANGLLTEQNLLFKVGDTVRVKKGILKDLIGIVEKNASDAGRIKILFKWLSGSMRAVLKYTELEKAA